MRFGMFDTIRWHEDVSGEDTITNALEQVEFADRLGIQDIWLGEHHFSRHGILSGIFSFMGAVAARTTQARIGTSIVVLPFHNPVQVAEEAAIIDIISNGRFNLGVGAGYQAQEFHGMGVDITKSREMFKEYLDVVVKCWEEGPLNYQGDFVNIENIWVIPKPVQKPGPPLYIAVSTSPESVDYAAKIGVPILVGGPTTTLGQTPEVVRLWHERMEHYGNPHEHIDLPVSANVYVAPTMEEAENDIQGLGGQDQRGVPPHRQPRRQRRQFPRQLQALGTPRQGSQDIIRARQKRGHPSPRRHSRSSVRASRNPQIEGDQPHIRQIRSRRPRPRQVAPLHRDVRDPGHARVRRNIHRRRLEPHDNDPISQTCPVQSSPGRM